MKSISSKVVSSYRTQSASHISHQPTEWKRLKYDITVILKGIRLSVLLDYDDFDKDILYRVIQTLTDSYDVLSCIGVVLVDEYLFLVNKDLYREKRGCFDCLFIDIDYSLDRPQVCQAMDFVREQFSHAFPLIDRALEDGSYVTGLYSFNITLCGWFLEYPCVYFNGDILKHPRRVGQHNCLAFEPLDVIQIHLTMQGDSQILLSFSYPSALSEDTSDFIDQTTEMIRSRVGTHTDTIHTTKQSVTLPSIIL
eukprot:TRINITY_DN3958_c0_g1_i1.p1 TRINITY_DN3958_c0_g1~~TRINITY_DN3958_c0_g1_i1.p1  ORF type:complete len:252 (-),score=39.00 TRINITY_DN3958_c0_g1_i1:199-954(-)